MLVRSVHDRDELAKLLRHDPALHAYELGDLDDELWPYTTGTHIWSSAYQLAAIGNVATRPEVRGQGLGSALVARWCRQVAGSVDHVVLNVKADNLAAVRLYRRLGFTTAGRFGAFLATARAPRSAAVGAASRCGAAAVAEAGTGRSLTQQ